MKIITCDFDHTLQFENGKPNKQTLKRLVEFMSQVIIIISTRRNTPENVSEIEGFCAKNDLTVSEIVLVSNEVEKLNQAIVHQSDLHFDDSEEALLLFDKQGIPNIDCFDKEAWAEWLKVLEIE